MRHCHRICLRSQRTSLRPLLLAEPPRTVCFYDGLRSLSGDISPASMVLARPFWPQVTRNTFVHLSFARSSSAGIHLFRAQPFHEHLIDIPTSLSHTHTHSHLFLMTTHFSHTTLPPTALKNAKLFPSSHASLSHAALSHTTFLHAPSSTLAHNSFIHDSFTRNTFTYNSLQQSIFHHFLCLSCLPGTASNTVFDY